MSETNTRVGVDFRGDLFYVARIDHSAGRQEVKALSRMKRQHLGDNELLTGGLVAVSLADENVLVKRLRINGSDNDDLLTRFELAQTLPDGESEYHFDTEAVGLEDRMIGLAVRRDRLTDYINTLLGEHCTTLSGARYRMRAAALASGYLHFCRRSGGDLICLADFAASGISIAFVFQGMVVDLCHQPLRGFDMALERGFARMAIEMKTLINFRCAALFAEGITTPLSTLVVSGEQIDNEYLEKFKPFFTIDICRPTVNTGFVSGEADLSQVPLDCYLVALGLAAN